MLKSRTVGSEAAFIVSRDVLVTSPVVKTPPSLLPPRSSRVRRPVRSMNSSLGFGDQNDPVIREQMGVLRL
jgi:hypothetical protein